MPRVLAALLVLCVAVPAIALAADTDPKKRINAADQAKARSILLRRTDFPTGWKALPPSVGEPIVCPGYAPKASDLTLSGLANADFIHTQEIPSVSTTSEVWASKADALASWTRSVKPALPRCLAQVFRDAVKKAGRKLTIVSYGKIAFPTVAPRTAAYRIVMRLLVEQPDQSSVQVPLTMHAILLGRGRADVSLLTFGVGSGVPLSDVRAFAKLLASRMAAAKL
jgi:hypothetical protein